MTSISTICSEKSGQKKQAWGGEGQLYPYNDVFLEKQIFLCKHVCVTEIVLQWPDTLSLTIQHWAKKKKFWYAHSVTDMTKHEGKLREKTDRQMVPTGEWSFWSLYQHFPPLLLKGTFWLDSDSFPCSQDTNNGTYTSSSESLEKVKKQKVKLKQA